MLAGRAVRYKSHTTYRCYCGQQIPHVTIHSPIRLLSCACSLGPSQLVATFSRVPSAGAARPLFGRAWMWGRATSVFRFALVSVYTLSGPCWDCLFVLTGSFMFVPRSASRVPRHRTAARSSRCPLTISSSGMSPRLETPRRRGPSVCISAIGWRGPDPIREPRHRRGNELSSYG